MPDRHLHIAYREAPDGFGDVAIFGRKVEALEYALDHHMQYAAVPFGVSLAEFLGGAK